MREPAGKTEYEVRGDYTLSIPSNLDFRQRTKYRGTETHQRRRCDRKRGGGGWATISLLVVGGVLRGKQ